jgi:ATP-binding cassette subfamily G (WHITE) protein 2 (PDR)
MANYTLMAGGTVYNPNTTLNCESSSITDTNVFSGALSSEYSERCRNFGLMWLYIVVNMLGAILVYWLAHVLQNKRKIKSSKEIEKDE